MQNLLYYIYPKVQHFFAYLWEFCWGFLGVGGRRQMVWMRAGVEGRSGRREAVTAERTGKQTTEPIRNEILKGFPPSEALGNVI